MGGRFDGIVIVSDMDGTYISKLEEGKKRNLDAIEYFKANGGYFTFASGRNLTTILEAVPNAEKVVNAPVIYCNGAGIYDLNKDREIATFPISHELVYDIQNSLAKLLSEREECRIKLSPITNGVYFKHKSHSENARDKCKIAYMKDNLYEIMSAKEWEEHHIHKFIFGGEAEAVRNIRKYLDPIYGDMSAMSQASAAYCECNGKGVSKATGIANMLKLCFGDKKMTLCVVGDFDNDIEMLKSSDYGFCPENANDKVKAVCHKCLCHHNKGVIADVIEYIDKNLI